MSGHRSILVGHLEEGVRGGVEDIQSFAGQPLDVFLAADDESAKDTVKQLVRDGGLRAVDAGPLALAHHVEALGYLNMAIQGDLGTNYASSVKVLA